jgi:tetratricopeptide (TPR) repeat protein
MAGLGDVYTSQGRLPEAGALLEDALARARKSNQPNNRTTGRVLNHYGRYLLRMRKYAEAEKVLLEAHQILSASDAGLAPVAARRLAELYKTWGNPEKAAEWRAEAASR